MNKFAVKSVVLIFALTLITSLAIAGDSMVSESGWFDFENCVFCKAMSEDPGMLEATAWESHNTANGSVTIMVVPAEYKEAMATATKKMEATGEEMQTGKINPMEANMCGHCQAYGALMMSGVNMETVEGDAATVTLMTSDDKAVVKRIHEMTDTNNKEMALMGNHSHDEHPKGEHPSGGEHPKGN
ncbi:MAG: hypothetical protein ACI9UK_002303 [Candidatus Krumholzibacteriia bacterium]|jgi:hypothetical protein